MEKEIAKMASAILVIAVVMGALPAYAQLIPHGINGIVYMSDGVTQAPWGTNFSVNNTNPTVTSGGYIEGTTGAGPFSGAYDVAINGTNGDIVIIKAWNATHYGITIVTLAGDMLAINVIINIPLPDTTPPASVSNPDEIDKGTTWILWNWTNPPDPDFNHTEVWINGEFKETIIAPEHSYNATGLNPDTTYEIGTITVDNTGNVNQTWMNDTATTISEAPGLICTCGDICVNTTGWWRDGGDFNASSTPIQHAIDNATAGDTICVKDGTYHENVKVNVAHLTIRSENGSANCIVQSASSNDHVFEVRANYVNISGFTAKGATTSLVSGIYLRSGTHNCNVSNNNASNNRYCGIHLYRSSNNTLSNNNASMNDHYGIYLDDSSYNTLTGNNASDNRYGIYLYRSSNNMLIDNNASKNWYGIRLGRSSNNTLTDNTMSGNTYNFGVWGWDLSHYIQNIDTSNMVDGKPVYYWVSQQDRQIPNDAGYVGVVNSTNIMVRDLTLTNNGQGVLFAYTKNSRIENVTATKNDDGISLDDSSYNTLTDNNASDNEVGIYLEDSSNNMLSNNIANSNDYEGIYLEESSYNTLTNNTANSNDYVGICLDESSNSNTLTNNTANSNDNDGIYLWESSYNTLTNNTANSNNNDGIWLDHSSNSNTLTGNTASNNADWDLHSDEDSHNNTVKDLTVASYPTTVSFTYDNGVGIKGVDTAPSDPAERVNISKYVNATDVTADSWIFLNVSYSDADISGMQESTLVMWKHNGSWYEVEGSGVNEAENYVYANITEFSIFAPLGNIPGHAMNVSTDYAPDTNGIKIKQDGTEIPAGENLTIGNTYSIYYKIVNEGDYNETVDVTVMVANSTWNQTIDTHSWGIKVGKYHYAPGGGDTWDTAGLAPGDYDLIVNASIPVDDDWSNNERIRAVTLAMPPNQPPVSDPNGPYTGTEGVAMTFDGTGSYDPDGTIVSYDWDFGDGNTGTGVSPTHTYAQNGPIQTHSDLDHDGDVDHDDTMIFLSAFNSSSGEPNYNPECDFDHDGDVDDDDLALFSGGMWEVTLTVTDNDGATDMETTTATIADTEPTADFSGTPTSGLEPLTVDFTDASTSYDGITAWDWDFDNDGVIDSTVQNPSNTYSEGTYTVSLTVTEGDGDSDTETKVDYITVTRENQPPVSDPNGPYTGTEGVAMSFDGSGSYDPDGSITSYAWDFDDGNTGTGVSPTHTYAQEGTYTVTLTVTDNDGATDMETTTATIADTEPTADFSGTPTSGLEPLTVDFTDASTSYDGITAWDWDFDNDGVIDSTVQNPSHTYSEGTYTVSLTVTDGDGDIDAETKVDYITVTRENQPPVSDPNGPYTGTEGVAMSFDGSGSSDPDGTIDSYAWDFDDGNTGTGMSPAHTYAQEGTYTVTLTVTDNDGATDMETTTATIADTEPTADFSGTPTSGLEPLTVDFTDASTSYDGITAWDWDFDNDGVIDSTVQNPSNTYSEGTYTVSLTVTEGDGDSDTETKVDYITVTRENQPPVSDPNGPYTGTEGVAMSFDGSGSYDPDGTIDSYAWDFDDGNTGTGMSPAHTYAQEGTYTVTLTVTDNDGATDMETTTATIADTEPTADFSGTPTSGLEPLTVDFTDASTSHDGITAWDWDFDNDGVIDSTVQNPSNTYSEGTYTVSLTVTEGDGDSDTETKVNYITVSEALQPDLCPDKYRWGSYNWDPFPQIFVGRQGVRFVNTGEGDAYNVTATVTCMPINVEASDNAVTLGDIPAGGSAWSSDTFEVRVDMTNPQDPNKGIVWRVEYDDAASVHHVVEDVPIFCGEPINCP